MTTLIVALVSSTIFFLLGVMVGREYTIREGLAPMKDHRETAYVTQPNMTLPEASENKGNEVQDKVDINFYDQLVKEGDQELNREASEEISKPHQKNKPKSSEKKKVRKAESKSRGIASKGRYALQVAAFRDRKLAEHLAHSLRKEGFSPHILRVTIPGKPGSFYRVWVGYYSNLTEAAQAKRHILKNPVLKISRATIVKR